MLFNDFFIEFFSLIIVAFVTKGMKSDKGNPSKFLLIFMSFGNDIISSSFSGIGAFNFFLALSFSAGLLEFMLILIFSSNNCVFRKSSLNSTFIFPFIIFSTLLKLAFLFLILFFTANIFNIV